MSHPYIAIPWNTPPTPTPLRRVVGVLNLGCLDAPLVALAWQATLALAFHARVPAATRAALFLTVWAIYLFDRLADGASVRPPLPMSRRQRFARRWAAPMAVLLGAVGLADACVVVRLDGRLLAGGAAIGALCLAYLATNRRADHLWQTLPVKELAIGALFALGTATALWPVARSPGVGPSVLLFALLCVANCATIAAWERELDARQGKTSLATRSPHLTDRLPAALAGVALLAGAAPRVHVPPAVALPLATSALLLGLLHAARRWLPPDERTALADLALLVPPLPGLLLALR